MNARRRRGFTLVEVLIVVVIMAVLAATIIPQFADSTNDAKVSTGQFNVHTIQSQIELYKAQHDGKLPGDDLAELLAKTDSTGAISPTGPYGPYIQEMPENPFNHKATIDEVTADPTTATVSTDGWIYNKNSGVIFLNHVDFLPPAAPPSS